MTGASKAAARRAGACSTMAAVVLLAACSQQLARNRQYLLRSSQSAVAPAANRQPVTVASPAAPIARELQPPSPISPRGGVTLAALGGPVAVQLRWAAPRPAASERFFVEVLAREATGNRAIFSAYVRRLEMTVTLPAVSGRYAWRVFGVAGAHAHYASSAWSEFGVDAGAPP